jgi:ureidoglycolate hydrolase
VIPGELSVPAAVRTDRNAVEILRVWITDAGQQVTLRHNVWEDPAAWGLLLADLARHFANAYAQAEGRDVDEVLERIRAGIEVEFESPTDEPRGGLDAG